MHKLKLEVTGPSNFNPRTPLQSAIKATELLDTFNQHFNPRTPLQSAIKNYL